MTATNMCSNFGGKWDSPPLSLGGGGAKKPISNEMLNVSIATICVLKFPAQRKG